MSALARLLCQRFFGLLILGLINKRRTPGKSNSKRVTVDRADHSVPFVAGRLAMPASGPTKALDDPQCLALKMAATHGESIFSFHVKSTGAAPDAQPLAVVTRTSIDLR